jgi:ubiquitin-protein ligase
MEISPYASEMRTRLIVLDISKIKLLNFQENEDFYLLHFIFYNSYSVKLSTDFDSYCYFESDTLDVEELNCIFLDSTKNTPESIVNKLQQFFNLNLELDTSNEQIQDVFHIYQKNEEISKALINYELLEKESKKLQESKTSMNISNIPKELLFNSNQIYKIIVQEIKNFNKNLKYKHFIEPINNNIYCLKLVCFLNNKNFKNDTFEIKINLEPKLYPYFPPRIEVIKPSIKFQLVFNLINLKILKLENWNSTISLEWLLISLIEQIDPIIHDYIKLESSKFEELDIKLSSITKEYSFEKELINISIQKVNVISDDNKFWKSGVGYGDDSRKAWDILSFIKEQEIFNYELTVLLKQIIEHISQESLNELYSSSLYIFLINRISGLTLLELERTKEVYNEILNILDKISKLDGLEQNFINNIGNAFVVISDEIKSLFILNQSETYLKIICVSDWFKSKMIVTQIISTEIISTNKNKEYEEVMKKLQFGTFEIQPNHLFKEYCAQKPEQKAIVRMVSEISTLKSGLPINWESSIWIRVSKTTINVFSFFISGPKDTPYENGIFEFHTAFPTNYPNSEPKVLINTTGGGTIRFNPNLYNCGKVCLSLLGTWSGQDGEKWNPKTSTFLQVLISIQSLILVETPYFNEPGWEKEMHTTKGQTNSKKYNEPLLIGTIKWAIIDMIKNPPNGMEKVIKNHFKFKKNEILITTQKWLNEMSSENSKELEKYRNEMILLFNTL